MEIWTHNAKFINKIKNANYYFKVKKIFLIKYDKKIAIIIFKKALKY